MDGARGRDHSGCYRQLTYNVVLFILLLSVFVFRFLSYVNMYYCTKLVLCHLISGPATADMYESKETSLLINFYFHHSAVAAYQEHASLSVKYNDVPRVFFI